MIYIFWLRTLCPCGWKSWQIILTCRTFSTKSSNWFSKFSRGALIFLFQKQNYIFYENKQTKNATEILSVRKKKCDVAKLTAADDLSHQKKRCGREKRTQIQISSRTWSFSEKRSFQFVSSHRHCLKL